MIQTIQVPKGKIEELCRKYAVKELDLISDDFLKNYGNGHEAEVLVEYLPEANTTIPDFYHLEEDLKKAFKADIVLISSDGVRPTLKELMLKDRVILYAN